MRGEPIPQRLSSVRLMIDGIEVQGAHGVYPEEREREQRFVIDLDIGGDLATAVESDDVKDTVDYDAIVQSVRETSRQRMFHLIESFAGAVADNLLNRFERIHDVRVRIQKLSVQSLGPGACPSVVVSKRRGEV